MAPYDDVLLTVARQVFPDSEITVADAIRLRLRHHDGGRAEYWCSIPEQESRGLPFEERVRMTVDYLRAFTIEHERLEEAPWERLMPLVRPAGFLRSPLVAGGSINGLVVARPLVDHLVEIVGVDYPDVTSPVTTTRAEAWRAPVDRLHVAARNNLLLSGLQTEILAIGATGEGAVHIVGPRGYETSWLAFPEVFARPIGAVANPVPGESRQLVFPVARNEMFVLPEADEAAIAAALGYSGSRYFNDRRAMAPFALVHEGGALVPWRRSGSPLARGSWLQRRRFVRDQYAAQVDRPAEARRLQDDASGRAAAPLPVAGHGILPTSTVVAVGLRGRRGAGGDSDGGVRGGGPLLPQVEYLDLRSERGRVVVPWQQAVYVLRLRLVRGRIPVQWAMRAWTVHRDVWERLRLAAVDPEVLERE